MVRRATVMYNPAAGGGRSRPEWLSAVQRALRDAAVEAKIVPTAGPGTAGAQAREAAATSAIVFACGGDGTVHEVVQGLAGQTATALGVVPMGSANVLSRHPVLAVQAQMRRATVAVPLGRVTFAGVQGQESRFFVCVAGAGADGRLARCTAGASKRRLGQWAYPWHAGRLCLQAELAHFEVTGTRADGTAVSALAVSAVCSRVRSLGGLLRPMVAPGSLREAALHLTLVRGRSRLTLPGWFVSSWLGMAKLHHGRSHHKLASCHCSAGLTGPVDVQADGEFLGRTPMSLTVAPEALCLLAGEVHRGSD